MYRAFGQTFGILWNMFFLVLHSEFRFRNGVIGGAWPLHISAGLSQYQALLSLWNPKPFGQLIAVTDAGVTLHGANLKSASKQKAFCLHPLMTRISNSLQVLKACSQSQSLPVSPYSQPTHLLTLCRFIGMGSLTGTHRPHAPEGPEVLLSNAASWDPAQNHWIRLSRVIWPSSPTAGHIYKGTESRILKKCLHTCIHNSTIDNSREMKEPTCPLAFGLNEWTKCGIDMPQNAT